MDASPARLVGWAVRRGGEVLDEARLVKHNHARAELAASDAEQTWRRAEVNLHRKRPGVTDLWPTREQAAHLPLPLVDIVTKDREKRVRIFKTLKEGRNSKIAHARGPVPGASSLMNSVQVNVHSGELHSGGLHSGGLHSGVRPSWPCSTPTAVISTPDARRYILHWRMSMSGFGGGMSTALRLDKYVLPNHMDLCNQCYTTRASGRIGAGPRRSIRKATGGGEDLPFKKHGEGKGKVLCTPSDAKADKGHADPAYGMKQSNHTFDSTQPYQADLSPAKRTPHRSKPSSSQDTKHHHVIGTDLNRSSAHLDIAISTHATETPLAKPSFHTLANTMTGTVEEGGPTVHGLYKMINVQNNEKAAAFPLLGGANTSTGHRPSRNAKHGTSMPTITTYQWKDKAESPKRKPPQLPRHGPRPAKRKRHMPATLQEANILGVKLRPQPERLPPNANGETYDVELLVSHRIIDDSGDESTEYLVMWAGDWPLEQRYTWEPEENIDAVN
ncbi:hypothetical protein PG991_009321 [Apiospora marii]|uniref:Chromo domain-containing protein n=1 Tax=Apiospora marii TaxID=335849 RepID=A0ABR1RKL4_9PEZI